MFKETVSHREGDSETEGAQVMATDRGLRLASSWRVGCGGETSFTRLSH